MGQVANPPDGGNLLDGGPCRNARIVASPWLSMTRCQLENALRKSALHIAEMRGLLP